MSPVNIDDDPVRSKIAIIVDQTTEMFCSLHVLAEPAHHLSNQDWATTTLTAMPSDLRDEITYIGQHFDQWLGIADLAQWKVLADLSVPEFLERLMTIDAKDVVHSVDTTYSQSVQQYKPTTLEAHQQAIREPGLFVQRLVRMLQRYWTDVFAAEWEKRYPLLDQRRKLEASRLDTSASSATWLTTLHERISYDIATDQLVFHKQHELRYTLVELERIVCSPSTFTAPHLLVGYLEQELLIAINVVPVTISVERVPAELLEVAKALADETRLRIFKAVLQRPHYTQELALSMGLAEPTVSRHLKILKAAKLVRSYKEGAFMQYAGLLDPVDRLPAAMRAFLRG